LLLGKAKPHGRVIPGIEWGACRVPKRNLVGVLKVLFRSGRLKISSKQPLAGTLQTELLNFRVKIDPVTAHDSYSAWREQDHNDLVLSVALAAWCAEQEPIPSTWVPSLDDSSVPDIGVHSWPY
jgi:hypothetical protein